MATIAQFHQMCSILLVILWPFKSQRHVYEAVASEDVELKADETREEVVQRTKEDQQVDKYTRRNRYIAVLCCVVLLIGLFALIILVFPKLAPYLSESSKKLTTDSPEHSSPSPSNANIRKEWRTLSSTEQRAYISAVLCLLNQPSSLNPNSNLTAYDDWPFIYSGIGYRTHHAAPFLPWHRYFLHLYETALRDKCGYEGSLVYWDWMLDWERLEESPVFDAETGFGGDGDLEGEITVSKTGRCVVDGPFAGVQAEWYDVQSLPHCLSRGFRDLECKLGHIDGKGISPAEIEEVLSLGSYEDFVARMESQVHDVIPYGISGEFETFTAPYDPLFFLHHTQLDRLWWLWQLRQPDGGLESYGGHKERHSMEMAGLDDLLGMGPLASKVKVREMMDIRNDMLGYEY